MSPIQPFLSRLSLVLVNWLVSLSDTNSFFSLVTVFVVYIQTGGPGGPEGWPAMPPGYPPPPGYDYYSGYYCPPYGAYPPGYDYSSYYDYSAYYSQQPPADWSSYAASAAASYAPPYTGKWWRGFVALFWIWFWHSTYVVMPCSWCVLQLFHDDDNGCNNHPLVVRFWFYL